MTNKSTSNASRVRKSPIIYVDDSESDRKLFELAARAAGITNKIVFFKNGEEALAYLKICETPFMVISDVNMPRMDGFELKAAIEMDKELSLKSIPFVYLSSSSERKDVKSAFYHQAQGYFEKPSDIDGLINILKTLITYWSSSELPGFYM